MILCRRENWNLIKWVCVFLIREKVLFFFFFFCWKLSNDTLMWQGIREHGLLGMIHKFIEFVISVIYPVGNYMLKVNNRNTRTRCEIHSKLIIKTTERRHWPRSDVFIVNFEYIWHFVQVFLWLTLSRYNDYIWSVPFYCPDYPY